ncbi:unnamed protein product [Phaeothamnion confervicola]
MADGPSGTIQRTGPGLFTRVVMRHVMAARKGAYRPPPPEAPAAREDDAADLPTTGAATAAAGPMATSVVATYRDFATVEESPTADRILVLPPTYFYPVPNDRPVELGSAGDVDASLSEWVRPESLAIHLWARSWQ